MLRRVSTAVLIGSLACLLMPLAAFAAVNYFSVVEAYSPTTNNWSQVASMPVGGRPAAAVAAPDGNIYLFGIEGTTATYAYSPATNRWTQVAPMPTRRAYFAAALGGDGRIYTIGGQTGTYAYTNVVEAYDPRTNHWSEASPIAVARAQVGAASGPDGRIYIFGGYSDTGQFLGSKQYASVAVYTPATDSWRTLADMPYPATAPTATTGPDGRIYVFGLHDATTVEAYSPPTGAWSAVPSLLVPQGGTAVATGSDGRIYVLGGSYTTETLGGEHGDVEISHTDYFNDVEAFAPGSGGWTKVAPMPTARVQLAAATGADGRIYAFGGWSVTDTAASSPTAPPPTQGGRGWIYGTVTLAGTTTPVPGAIVTLADTPLTTGVLPSGSYQFAAISTTDGADGGPTYTVTITPPQGYVAAGPASQQVTVQGGRGVEADFTLRPPTASAATSPGACQFILGFKALHDAIPRVVGDCLEDEQHSPGQGGTPGDGLQHTARGLLVWRRADNFTAFTDGYHTWVNGPLGIQERLNTQRFPWEANPGGLPAAP